MLFTPASLFSIAKHDGYLICICDIRSGNEKVYTYYSISNLS